MDESEYIELDVERAREITLAINLDEETGHYAQCKNAIKDSIKKGQYYCFIYFKIEPEIVERLKNEGFKVEKQSVFVGEYRISWEM